MRSFASTTTALAQLETYLEVEGPLRRRDRLLAGSHAGGCLPDPLRADASGCAAAFKCAIFFSSGRPIDPWSLDRGELRLLEPSEHSRPLMSLPTASIWGRNDTVWPGSSETLWGLCDPAASVSFIHEEGHNIPGGRAKDAVMGAVGAIRRTIDRVEMAH